MVSTFKQCITKGDYSGLGQGAVTQEGLHEAWISIYSEYIDLSDEPDVTHLVRLVRNIMIEKNKLAKIRLAVSTLFNMYVFGPQLTDEHHEKFIYELRKCNYRYKYDRSEMKQYLRDLDLVVTRSKSIETTIELMELEAEAFESKMKGEIPSELYFTKTLVRLESITHYPIIEDQTTLLKYCVLRQEYTRRYKEQEKLNKNAK